MIAASLTRVAYGVDNDPEFKAWDELAEQFQTEGPSGVGGRTILEIG